jgi:alkanesulfonate monooxygenase SsuD/methylene tetrahydromethanopterin reductase-like flavin-dependent oxidoreductase (luciferase family)
MANDVGVLLMFQKYGEDISDRTAYENELAMGVLVEELGFGRLWIVEHHFDGYSMSPDNFLELAYFAAKTSKIKLGVGAAILPWNDPLRVAEKVILLDHVSGGRAILALGRGLARMEYEALRIPMSEARERFDEAADLVIRAIETGFAEGPGPFYPQPRIELRPRPFQSFRGRICTVAATSPESQAAAARVGGPMMSYVTADTAKLDRSLTNYRDHFRKIHEREAPWPVLTDICYCHRNPDIAAERAFQYIGQGFALVIDHYEMAGEHFKNIKGYQSYVSGSDGIRTAGKEASIKAYVPTQLWGTPSQIIERFRARIEIIGPYTPNFQFGMGGLPNDWMIESASLFARGVLPAITEILDEAKAKQAA